MPHSYGVAANPVLQAPRNAEKIVYPMVDDLFATMFPVSKKVTNILMPNIQQAVAP